MKNWKSVVVTAQTTLIDSMSRMNEAGLPFVLICNAQEKLLGILTDGDLRRLIIQRTDLNTPVEKHMNEKPSRYLRKPHERRFKKLMIGKSLTFIPLVDNQQRLMAVELLEELIKAKTALTNEVVLMAGGLGTRLKELTAQTPKPLLNVGNRPLLESIIERFVEQGLNRFTLCLNYKSEQIESYFGDGQKFQARIRYVVEKERLGTAGALALLSEKPQAPVIVMNGDVLTGLDFARLLEFHQRSKAVATMAVRPYEFQIPYGVIQTDGENILSLDEKPVQRYFVNAGIYVLNPDVLERIPKNSFFDMTTLFDQVLQKGERAKVYPVHEYWLDIGQNEDYQRANRDYATYFRK